VIWQQLDSEKAKMTPTCINFTKQQSLQSHTGTEIGVANKNINRMKKPIQNVTEWGETMDPVVLRDGAACIRQFGKSSNFVTNLFSCRRLLK